MNLFKKDSPDQKSGFGFAERNAKSVLRSKIRFWIHRKERTLRNLRWHTHDTSANQKLLFSRSVRISPRAFSWQRSFILDNIISYDLEHDSSCERHTVFALKCFRRHMLLEICSKCEILLKCCPKCKIVLQTQKSASKVLSAMGKGLHSINCQHLILPKNDPENYLLDLIHSAGEILSC